MFKEYDKNKNIKFQINFLKFLFNLTDNYIHTRI